MDQNESISGLRLLAMQAKADVSRKKNSLLSRIDSTIAKVSDPENALADRRLQKLRALKSLVYASAASAERSIDHLVSARIEQMRGSGAKENPQDRGRPISRVV